MDVATCGPLGWLVTNASVPSNVVLRDGIGWRRADRTYFSADKSLSASALAE